MVAPKDPPLEAVFYDMTPRLILPPPCALPPRPAIAQPGPLPAIVQASTDLAGWGRYEYRALDNEPAASAEATVRPGR